MIMTSIICVKVSNNMTMSYTPTALSLYQIKILP